MANVRKIFESTINEAIQSAENVTDFKERALAFAEISKALAMTGLVNGASMEPAGSKSDLEETAPVLTEEKEEENTDVVGEVEEEQESSDDTSEEEVWTEEAIEEKAESLEFLREVRSTYDDENINECLSDFSNGLLTNIDEDVTPDNIDAFVIYLKELIEGNEEQAS